MRVHKDGGFCGGGGETEHDVSVSLSAFLFIHEFDPNDSRAGQHTKNQIQPPHSC